MRVGARLCTAAPRGSNPTPLGCCRARRQVAAAMRLARRARIRVALARPAPGRIGDAGCGWPPFRRTRSDDRSRTAGSFRAGNTAPLALPPRRVRANDPRER